MVLNTIKVLDFVIRGEDIIVSTKDGKISIYRFKFSQFELEKSFLIKASGKINFSSNDTFYIGHDTAVAKFKIKNQTDLIDDWIISEGP